MEIFSTAQQNVTSMRGKTHGAPVPSSPCIQTVWIATDSEERTQDAHAKKTRSTEHVPRIVKSMQGRMSGARVPSTPYTRIVPQIVTCMQGKTRDVRATSFPFTKIAHRTVEYSLDKTRGVRVNKIHSILIVQQIVKNSSVRILVAHAAKIL